MGRPPHDPDDYLEWQQRLESQKESGLSIELFCLQEGVSKSTFHRWARQLRDGIPESLKQEQAEREAVLVEVICAAGALRPWKAPKS